MNVSVRGEYALQALFDLTAQTNRQEPVKIADIARRQSIPQKFLELILASLKQGGFVTSRRGAEGGYLLARPPEQITVGEVLRYIETAKTPRHTVIHPLGELWKRVDEATSNVLDRATLADLVRDWQERQAIYVMNWDI